MNYLRLNQIAVEKMTVQAALKHWQLGVFRRKGAPKVPKSAAICPY